VDTVTGCGRVRRAERAAMAVAFALGVAACGDDAPHATHTTRAPVIDRAAADPATGATSELDGAAPAYGDAVLAELTGDEPAARAAYERVLAGDVPPALAGRAALHLAQIESRSGRTRHALDLVARATALAPADPVVTEGAAAIRADVVAAAGAGDIRGPRLGTPLHGVAHDVADAFATAERALAQWHKARLRIVIEALTRSINDRINHTTRVVTLYREVAERGGVARVAASYRTGSAFHDLALELVFADLPPELEKGKASLRNTLHNLAIAYLKKAVAEYRDAIDAPTDQAPDAELWRLAAETNMRRAMDVLRAEGVRIADSR
jgi:tetratricopeptide (TPR) repeat protein